MTALLLAPHADDETLFAAYTLMRYRPHVVVCLKAGDRSGRETEEAIAELGLDPYGHIDDAEPGAGLEQWPYAEERPIPNDLLELLWTRRDEYDRVFAPAVEEGGHEQHNEIGRIAVTVFGVGRVTGYLTYTRAGGRSTWGTLVEPTTDWIAMKLRALSCYQSQIDRDATRPWFYDQLDLREWVA